MSVIPMPFCPPGEPATLAGEPLLMGIPEAAKIMGIPPSALRKLIRENRFRCLKLGYRSVFVRRADIDAFLHKHCR